MKMDVDSGLVTPRVHENVYTVIHFYFGADLVSVISVQAFFT